MINKILSSIVGALSVLTFSSCLSDNEDKTTTYDDTAVTAFSLSTVNRYLHTTTSDGKNDSIYKSTYSASGVKFYIDQLQRQIYNPDSLPYGCDPSKIVCSITSKNSGTILLNLKDKAGDDSLAYFSTTDSLDFTNPIRVRVVNMGGTAYREYTVKVNVHKQKGTEMTWNVKSYADLSGVGERRLVNNNGVMFLFGVKDNQTVGFKENGGAFQQLSSQFSSGAYNNVVAMGGYLYLKDGGNILRSMDGQNWEQRSAATNLIQLIGASDKKLYGLTGDGIVSSSDNGATWTKEALDTDVSKLPTENINFVCLPSEVNVETNNLIIVGTRNNSKTFVWRKVEENAAGSQAQPWAFYPDDPYSQHLLPYMSNLQVISYDDGLLAVGGSFPVFYFSNDEGLTWLSSSEILLADDFDKAATPFTMACDNSNHIYLSKANDAKIWLGRLARLGWVNQ